MQPIYMVCGVPASGKSWVCEQLTDRFTYVRNDDYIDVGLSDYFGAVRAAVEGEKPVLTDCPFGERNRREQFEERGFDVRPYFIVECPALVQARYEKREGRPVARNVLSRAVSIKDRAKEWGAPSGSSVEILNLLLQVKP